MNHGLNRSRFIVGVILIVVAIVMFLFLGGQVSTAGAVAILVLGLVSIAISRRK
jgi:O-antigen ligase